MAKNGMLLTLLTIISSMFMISMAQSSTSGCTNVLISLSPCLDYITGNSTKPTSSCCTQLASVVDKEPECLCQVINGGGSSLAAGMNINQTQALGLPSACKVSTPSLSRCNAASPSGSPTSTTSGSKSTPKTQGDSSKANKSKSSAIALPLLWAMFFIGSYALAQ